MNESLRLLCGTTILMLATAAHATSFVVTTDMIGAAMVGTTDTSVDISSSLVDDKIVLATRDDAAGFIASRGDIAEHSWRPRSCTFAGNCHNCRPATCNWPRLFSAGNHVIGLALRAMRA